MMAISQIGSKITKYLMTKYTILIISKGEDNIYIQTHIYVYEYMFMYIHDVQ